MHPVPDCLMLFAAGFGTRMGALVRDRPKPLVQVAGRALIDHALALADDAGIARKVVNIHYLGGQIATHLSSRSDTVIADERAEILDTGGGLRAARGLLAAPAAFTLNSDVVWTGPNPLTAVAGRWRTSQARVVMALAPISSVRGRRPPGDFEMNDGGQIIGRGGPWVYLGAQILDLSVLDAMPDGAFSLNLVWDRLIAEGMAEGVVHPGGWCDVGHPAGIAEAEAMLREAAP